MANKKNGATLRDIAKRVNSTVNTVSCALRGTNRISPKTTKRIREIAQELGYTPRVAKVSRWDSSPKPRSANSMRFSGSLPRRPCPVCRKPFTPRKQNNHYCSERCSIAARSKRWREISLQHYKNKPFYFLLVRYGEKSVCRSLKTPNLETAIKIRDIVREKAKGAGLYRGRTTIPTLEIPSFTPQVREAFLNIFKSAMSEVPQGIATESKPTVEKKTQRYFPQLDLRSSDDWNTIGKSIEGLYASLLKILGPDKLQRLLLELDEGNTYVIAKAYGFSKVEITRLRAKAVPLLTYHLNEAKRIKESTEEKKETMQLVYSRKAG